MPKGYVIGRIDLTDPERYARYAAVTPAIAAKHGGRFIVRSGRFEAKEGAARARNVVIEFPSYADALAFYDDPEYQAALPDAIGGSEREMIIIEGLEDA